MQSDLEPSTRVVPKDSGRDRIVSFRWAHRLFAGVTVVAAAAVVVSVTHVFGWTVDDQVLWLLGIVAALPLADQLRRLKIGSLELELDQLRGEVAAVDDRLKREVAAAIDVSSEESGASSGADESRNLLSKELATPIDRIVWVDDVPANNAVFIPELRRRYEVRIAVDTTEGRQLIGQAPERTLAITDAVRGERGKLNVHAGADLLSGLRTDHPEVPALVFAGTETVLEHSEALYDAGALIVTDSFVELSSAVRNITALRLERAVRVVVHETTKDVATIMEGDSGCDLAIVTPKGTMIAFEVRDWRRRPRAEALSAVWDRFSRLMSSEKVARAILVLSREVLTPAQMAELPPGVSVVTIDRLRDVIERELSKTGQETDV